jgi:hypothetical protein
VNDLVFYSDEIDQFIIVGLEPDGDAYLDSGEERVYSADLNFKEVVNKVKELGAINLGEL